MRKFFDASLTPVAGVEGFAPGGKYIAVSDGGLAKPDTRSKSREIAGQLVGLGRCIIYWGADGNLKG